MKIGISANALRLSGGLERYAMDLVRGLADAGFTGSLKPAFFARKIDPALAETKLVEAHRISVGFLPGKLRDTWFSWVLERARRKANVDVLIGCNRVESSEIAICGGTHIGFLNAGPAPDRTRKAAVPRGARDRRAFEADAGRIAHALWRR
jgi:hypothetical protein